MVLDSEFMVLVLGSGFGSQCRVGGQTTTRAESDLRSCLFGETTTSGPQTVYWSTLNRLLANPQPVLV